MANSLIHIGRSFQQSRNWYVACSGQYEGGIQPKRCTQELQLFFTVALLVGLQRVN